MQLYRYSYHLEAKERERTHKPGSPVLSLIPRPPPKGRPDTNMIRHFTALCKTLFKQLSDQHILERSIEDYNHHGAKCPNCGAVGNLSPHGGYTRYLVCMKKALTASVQVSLRRFKCNSCKVTHSLIPDTLIPYSQYSLRYMLYAIISYYDRKTSVSELCQHLGIAVSTLYAWKNRLIDHTELLLGLVTAQQESSVSYLQWLVNSNDLSEVLHRFFWRWGFSFMQRRSMSTARSHPT